MGRGLAALSVLLFHVNIVLKLPKYLNNDIFPFFNFGYCGINYFFVLSGFVIFLAHEKDIGQAARVPMFLWKRFRRVYPVLWMVLLLFMLTICLLYLLPKILSTMDA